MSGTSLDGVDAALVAFPEGLPPQQLAQHYLPYPHELRKSLLELHVSGPDELHRSATLAIELSRLYADSVQQLLRQQELSPDAVTAIGCHGQTVRHQPTRGYTLQLFNPALLAELTDISVVCDFRSRDIAAGGQGAPLVPAFHQAIFSKPEENRIIANIGGIANLTSLGSDGQVSGFDCGPGNALLDEWIELHRQQRYDRGGEWAASGRVIPALLDRLCSHPFFSAPAPKSTGREDFNLDWLQSQLSGSEAPQDVQATLVELTAYGISRACRELFTDPFSVYLCGGGSHNHTLVNALQQRLQDTAYISSTLELGIDPDWVEAVAFAWLANQTLQKRAGNLPAVTGAKGPRVLGAIYPA